MKKNQKTSKVQNDETNVTNQGAAKKKAPAWKSVMIGGVPGIILGAAGTFVGTSAAAESNDSDSQQDNDTPGIHIPDNATVATEVNDDMSFGEAFAAARQEVGPGGVFTWHGNLYNTYTQEEWSAQHQEEEEEEEAAESGDTEHIPAQEDQNQEEHIPAQEDQNQEDQVPVQEEQNQEDQVPVQEDQNQTPAEADGQLHIEGNDGADAAIQTGTIYSGYTEDGQLVTVVEAQVDGHDAVFVDVDGDNYIDTVAIDANDNGVLDNNEILDATESDLHLLDIVSTEEAGISTPEDDIYNNTDDYSKDDYNNNADVAAF